MSSVSRSISRWSAAAAVALAFAVSADAVLEAPPRTPMLRVPFTRPALEPTGHFDVNTWTSAVSTYTLLDERGTGAVPVSEARFLWGSGKLYMFFYAADPDLQVRTTRHDAQVWKDDGVVLEFPSVDSRKFVVDMSPTGVSADAICPQDADLGDERCDLGWESGVRVSADFDGTINEVGDFDEEWAIEMALPLASIGVHPPFAGAQIPFSLVRCEVAYGGKRACGSWPRTHAPGALVLAQSER